MKASLNARATDAEAGPAQGAREGVVLIHGLGRTPASMWLLGRRLAARGYRVRRVGYPSLRIGLTEATARVREEIASGEIVDPRRGWRRVHLVGHSLGGLIARRIAETPGQISGEPPGEPAGEPPFGRVVQIGAPNRGSEVAARLAGGALATRSLGPALAELARLPGRVARREGVGAIAGTAHCGLPRRLHGLAGPHDGLVSVRSAWTGAAGRAAVPVIHTLLPASRAVARLVAAWLGEGSFAPAGCGRIAR